MNSEHSESELPRGRTLPRFYTQPVVTGPPGPCGCGCALTEDTSFGFLVIDFAAKVLKRPLDPWQRWLVIHGGELGPDGYPRWRRVLVLVARQNGKTELLVVLALFWLYVEGMKTILGTSSKHEYAKESWTKVVEIANKWPRLRKEIESVRKANGEVELSVRGPSEWDDDGEEIPGDLSRYKIAAANSDAGRSLTVDKLIMDELRQQFDWDCYNAAINTQNAVMWAQAWLLSNQGDDRSVVLHSVREGALKDVASGRVGKTAIFEWSAPEGTKPTDIAGLAQANPNVGHRLPWDDLLDRAEKAQEAGGEELTGFQIEAMCMRVPKLNPAVDMVAWRDKCQVDSSDLSKYRRNVVMCYEMNADGDHVTLIACAKNEYGRYIIDVVQVWSGVGAVAAFRKDLPRILEQNKPRAMGWIPGGPSAAVAAEMVAQARKDGKRWPPPGVHIEALRKDQVAVCMGFASLVKDGAIGHSGDPLINSHVGGAEKKPMGDGWRFERGGADCDAAYAAAGAVFLAQTIPPRARIGVVGPRDPNEAQS